MFSPPWAGGSYTLRVVIGGLWHADPWDPMLLPSAPAGTSPSVSCSVGFLFLLSVFFFFPFVFLPCTRTPLLLCSVGFLGVYQFAWTKKSFLANVFHSNIQGVEFTFRVRLRSGEVSVMAES